MSDTSKPAWAPPEGYDTEEETAAEFGVDPRTLKRWRAERKGPPVTYLGRRPIYNRDSKLRWLKAQEMPMPRERATATARRHKSEEARSA
jgi:hypothetical protein